MHVLLSPHAAADHGGHGRPASAAHSALTGTALLAALLRSRLPVGAVAPAALGVGCAGLSLCAVFRTDEAGSVQSVSGRVLGLAERVTLGLEIALLFAMADMLRVGRRR
ncbi:hypothetical protein [Streptomyces sp. NBC_00827]|uniref:hypothetical protein n=1 Tax=Streptomyces sp. NBC_00827 TaxID=2903677 RepID=UPI00386DB6B5|nr:hypothetical protein OG569_39035 [Streptomyces sp. NBC_00827]